MTRRSSVLRAPAWFFGRSASIALHCASLNQNSPAIIQAPIPIRLESQLHNILNALIEFEPGADE
jgi:hypothetical protein